MNNNATIARILKILRGQQFAPFVKRMKIFGSLAKGSANPKDVDIMLDYSDVTTGLLMPPDEVYLFLALARKFYGSVDVFVKVGHILYVRSDDASDWITSKNAKKIWKDSQTDGRPVSDIFITEGTMKSFKDYVTLVESEDLNHTERFALEKLYDQGLKFFEAIKIMVEQHPTMAGKTLRAKKLWMQWREEDPKWLPENATAGATSAASIATNVSGTAAGAIGVGFDPNGHKGIYQGKPSKKSKAAPVLKR